ncbi:MAG: hemerythrin family protein [Chloroflexota bacterium]
MKIEWDPDKMATGVPDVDRQHQEWIRRYNQFDEAVSAGKGLESIRSTLDFFATYAETHFALEEACMDEHRCPAAEVNRAAHNKMRFIVSGLQDYVSKKGASLVEVESLRQRMADWLTQHILTVDIQLRNCVAHNSPTDPKQ